MDEGILVWPAAAFIRRGVDVPDPYGVDVLYLDINGGWFWGVRAGRDHVEPERLFTTVDDPNTVLENAAVSGGYTATGLYKFDAKCRKFATEAAAQARRSLPPRWAVCRPASLLVGRGPDNAPTLMFGADQGGVNCSLAELERQMVALAPI